MFHRSCAFCAQPAAAATNLGPLLGPIRDSKNSAADDLYAHRLCALWSSEVGDVGAGREGTGPARLCCLWLRQGAPSVSFAVCCSLDNEIARPPCSCCL